VSNVRTIGDVEVKPLAVFRGLTIENQDFSGWNFAGVTFVDCLIRNCKFKGSRLSDFDGEDDASIDDVIENWEEQRDEWKRQLYGIDGPSPWRRPSSLPAGHDDKKEATTRYRSAEDVENETEREMIHVRDLRSRLGIDATATNPDDDTWRVQSVWHRTRLENCDFDDADMYGGHFSSSAIQNSRFRDSDLTFAVFSDSTITESDYSRAHLESADFLRSRSTKSLFGEAIFDDSYIEDSTFEDCSFEKVCLNGSEFIDSTLADCDFTESVFEEILVSNLTMTGTTNLELEDVEEAESAE